MCGIVGYIGKSRAMPILLEALKRLEYRGYDSAGIAVLENGKISLEKTAGKISRLEKRLAVLCILIYKTFYQKFRQNRGD